MIRFRSLRISNLGRLKNRPFLEGAHSDWKEMGLSRATGDFRGGS